VIITMTSGVSFLVPCDVLLSIVVPCCLLSFLTAYFILKGPAHRRVHHRCLISKYLLQLRYFNLPLPPWRWHLRKQISHIRICFPQRW